MIAAMIAAVLTSGPNPVGPPPEIVLEVDTPAHALEACQAQRAAKDGVVANVICMPDGSFMVDCASPRMRVHLSDDQPKPFMVCRSRWNIEPADQRPFCRLTGWNSSHGARR